MDGERKNGVEIVVEYQAVNTATSKTVTMDIYDEAFALDAGKSVAAMTEIVATGRYKAAFTPDEEGVWTAVMLNTSDSNGPVVKTFRVCGHNLDGVGDAIAAVETKVDTVDTAVDAIKVVTDAESGVKAAVVIVDGKIDALADIDATAVNAEVAAALVSYDPATGAEIDALNDIALNDVTGGTDVATAESNIRGGSDTLGTVKTAIDVLGSPAMVG